MTAGSVRRVGRRRRRGRRQCRGLRRGSRRFRIRTRLYRIGLCLGGRDSDRRVGLLFTCGSVRRDLEQQSVLHSHEQDRRRPLHVVLVRVDRLARLGHCRVDRVAIRQRGVELRREHDGRPVRDLELHADDGGDLPLDQACGHARERVLHRASTSFTGVEHGQSERDLVLQDRAQLDAGDPPGPAVIVLEEHDAVVRVVVVATMPDVMEDVIVGLAQLALEGSQCRRLEPVDGHGARLNERRERLTELRLLGRDIDRLRVGRCRNDPDDPQRQGDLQRPLGLREVQVAHDRCPCRDRHEARMVVQVLPRDLAELGRAGQ